MAEEKLVKNDSKYTIREMPLEDRPQEKLIKFGAEYLSNAELLALIIRTGTKSDTAVNLSQKILNSLDTNLKGECSLSELNNIPINELKKIKGIGDSKAAMILAAIELGKRINKSSLFQKVKITSPSETAKFVMSNLRFKEVETFKIITLNTKKEVEYIEKISTGTINATLVHPREVFKRAINRGAHSIILIHNHPTGDPSPSKEDINLTKRLCETGEMVGIPVLDHLIIGDNIYCSFLEEGLI